jgi:enoyl-CoA hydratase/carnithine racemase
MSGLQRSRLEEYAPKYDFFAALRRENGVLELRLHTNGGSLKWGLEAHSGLIALMQDINADPDNECVILTGTGESFLAELNEQSWVDQGFTTGFGEHQAYDIMYHGQTREPLALLDIKVPVISAINGPMVLHAELGLLNDIVLCSDNTYFYEGHWDGLGIVPGDGVHTLFRELLGPNRGRYFLLMGQKIFASEALQLGLVGEVVSRDKLLDRAWEIAEKIFMSKHRVQRRLARSLLIQPWRELFVKELPFGMSHQALACYAHWPMAAKKGSGS